MYIYNEPLIDVDSDNRLSVAVICLFVCLFGYFTSFSLTVFLSLFPYFFLPSFLAGVQPLVAGDPCKAPSR